MSDITTPANVDIPHSSTRSTKWKRAFMYSSILTALYSLITGILWIDDIMFGNGITEYWMIMYGCVVLFGALLLFFVRSRSWSHIGKRDVRWLVPMTLLGMFVSSFIYVVLPGCCSIRYRVAFGFPFSILTLHVDIEVPRTADGSLQHWPGLYRGIYTFIQHYPDMVSFPVLWSSFFNFFFYAYISILLLLICKFVWYKRKPTPASPVY